VRSKIVVLTDFTIAGETAVMVGAATFTVRVEVAVDEVPRVAVTV
jgi:hypothetical protein